MNNLPKSIHPLLNLVSTNPYLLTPKEWSRIMSVLSKTYAKNPRFKMKNPLLKQVISSLHEGYFIHPH